MGRGEGAAATVAGRFAEDRHAARKTSPLVGNYGPPAVTKIGERFGAFLPDATIPLNGLLIYDAHNWLMKMMLTMAIALLILNFVDEHFNGGAYTSAAAQIFLQIRHSFRA